MTDQNTNTRGGSRKGAGRPAVLNEPARRNITFEFGHFEKLKRIGKKLGISSMSAIIRHLIDSHPDADG